jgi:hypothetical protein
MNDRKQENIKRINKLWKLHRPRAEGLKPGGRCLAFVIDRRYVEGEDGFEERLAVSFGHPVVGQEGQKGLLPIPGQPGEFVFGVHLIGIEGDKLGIYDGWMDTLHAGGCTDAVEAETRGRAILDAMSDEEYLTLVRSSRDDQRPLKVSSRHLLEDFEIAEPNPA